MKIIYEVKKDYSLKGIGTPEFYLGGDVLEMDECWHSQGIYHGLGAETYIRNDIRKYEGLIGRSISKFEAPMDSKELQNHAAAKKVLTLKPGRCSSHTVLVMDKSGSMNTHDISLHRDRKTAAYSNMAMELVAEQLFEGTANNRDVVSLHGRAFGRGGVVGLQSFFP